MPGRDGRLPTALRGPATARTQHGADPAAGARCTADERDGRARRRATRRRRHLDHQRRSAVAGTRRRVRAALRRAAHAGAARARDGRPPRLPTPPGRLAAWLAATGWDRRARAHRTAGGDTAARRRGERSRRRRGRGADVRHRSGPPGGRDGRAAVDHAGPPTDRVTGVLGPARPVRRWRTAGPRRTAHRAQGGLDRRGRRGGVRALRRRRVPPTPGRPRGGRHPHPCRCDADRLAPRAQQARPGRARQVAHRLGLPRRARCGHPGRHRRAARHAGALDVPGRRPGPGMGRRRRPGGRPDAGHDVLGGPARLVAVDRRRRVPRPCARGAGDPRCRGRLGDQCRGGRRTGGSGDRTRCPADGRRPVRCGRERCRGVGRARRARDVGTPSPARTGPVRQDRRGRPPGTGRRRPARRRGGVRRRRSCRGGCGVVPAQAGCIVAGLDAGPADADGHAGSAARDRGRGGGVDREHRDRPGHGRGTDRSRGDEAR